MAEIPGFNPEAERHNKVEAIKTRLVEANFLKPDEKQRDEMSEKMNGVFGELRHGFRDVQNMELTINDPARTEIQKKNAEEDKKILVEATYSAIRELSKDNPELENEFFLGSKHIDNMLPAEMIGLGKEVGRNYVSNEQIDKQLNLLETTRQNVDFSNPSSVEVLSQKIEIRIGKLAGEDFDDEQAIAEQDVVLTLLNEEKRRYSQEKKEENKDRRRGRKENDFDFEPPVKGESGEWDGGARWELKPEYAADAMKFMDNMRWTPYTPPEWMKKLDIETQIRIEYMVMVNDGASFMSRAGKDLEKIQGNPMWFAFDNEKFTKLFNEDFKLVCSKMIHDLCDLDTDKNGRKCLIYKEGINKKGRQGIRADVETKLETIRDYKEEMANFLAEYNGRKEPSYMDKMNAYTAWNLFFMFGDSSLADKKRILPTYGGIINDGMRTLNPEYKARGKWKVDKSGNKKDLLFESEYFGGSIADYVLAVNRIEAELGKPIDGTETILEKIANDKLKIFANKMCYGFFDFTHGTRDLFKADGTKFTKEEDVTLATLLMDYADFDEDGKLIRKNENSDFNFGHNQVDFMNWFRDQIETAALSYSCMMGKADVKSVEGWAHNVKDKVGMVRGIKINERETYLYTKSPDYWANMILGSFGADTSRLSSDYIYMKTPKDAGEYYNLYLYRLLAQDLNIGPEDVNLNAVMRYMGVDVKGNSDPRSFILSVATKKKREDDYKRTAKLYRKMSEKSFE